MHSAAILPPSPSAALQCFDFVPRTRLVFGPGSLERVGELARELGAKHALVVTDPGVAAAGHVARAVCFIEAAGLHTTIYDTVRENPTTTDVDRCVEVARRAAVDLLIGIGGGSSLDTAKGCNFILTNGGRMQDYWGIGKASRPMLPLIAVPTTAGTGSECQSFALISDEQTHQKMACGDPKAAARVALLDPELTVSQPPRVTACTGIDALAHALETAVTKKRNAFSAMYSREALRLCLGGIERVLRDADDLEARAAMLLGAAYAGTAIENSMLGAAHSAANPLTAHYNLVHGHAIGVMLPRVIAWNARDPETHDLYLEHAAAAGLGSVDELLDRLRAALRLAELDVPLAELGVEREKLPLLAREAAAQWTAKFNPREIGEAEFERLYEEAFA